MNLKISYYLPYHEEQIQPVNYEGEKLVIGSSEYDFSPLPEGATLPWEAHHCPYIVGDVTRVNGVVQIHLHLPKEAEDD